MNDQAEVQPMASARRWFLVHAKTGSEVLAEQNLLRQKYQIFLPRTWRTIRHARKIRNVVQAYFPGYLFVSLHLETQQWRAINGTLGVIRLITANERPLAAPKGLVETLMQAVDERGFVALARTLWPGDPVRIIKGPFADQLGVVERLDGGARVRVLLEIMNARLPVSLDREAVSAA